MELRLGGGLLLSSGGSASLINKANKATTAYPNIFSHP